jgi:hypothetical protein
MTQVLSKKSDSNNNRSAPAFFQAPGNNGTPFFQAKLHVAPANDIYEKEADSVAEKVMRMPEKGNQETILPSPTPVTSVVQSKCANCEEKEVQRSASNTTTTSEAPSLVTDAINRSGNALDPGTQSFMENRFGYNFSDVRVHHDTVAAKSAQAINALAYTSGNNIVFNRGQYSPGTESGKKLIAHELTHVVQQGQSSRGVQRMVEVQPGVELNTMGFHVRKTGNVYLNDEVSKSSVLNEIVTGLFYSPRVFRLVGSTSAAANDSFKAHIFARYGVVEFAAKKKYKFGAGAGVRMNEDFWDVDHAKNTFKPKVGVDEQEAMDDLNKNKEPAREYAIGCEAASFITLKGGGKSKVVEDNIPDDIWIPGDWGYIKNDKHPPNGTPGQEGENIIYVGLDRFWGHISDTVTYKTLQEWFDIVDGWDSGARVVNRRQYPAKGLNR